MKRSINQIISSSYYDPKMGYIGADALLKKVQAENSKITKRMVTDFMNKQYGVQVNKEHRRDTSFTSVKASQPMANIQMDIIIYDRYEFNKYKYILCMIDVNSRYANARAMTSRKFDVIMSNFQDMLKTEFHGVPEAINCDNEFNKIEFNKFAKKNNITMYYSDPNQLYKNSIIERFNRTLAHRLQLWRSGTGRHDWNKILADIIYNYNHTKHSTIQATPDDVFNKKDINHQEYTYKDTIFKVNDVVRKRIENTVFSKGDALKYSDDLYRVNKVDGKKIYLTNTKNNTILKIPVKDVQIQKINSVDNRHVDLNEEVIHKKSAVEKKISRVLKKDGVDVVNVRLGMRKRAAKSYVDAEDYGDILWD